MMRTRPPRGPAHWLLTLIAAAACTSGPAYSVTPAPRPPQNPQLHAQPAEIPPQTFSPEGHQGRSYPAVEAVAFASAPALSTRSTCVAAGAVPEGRPNAPAAKTPKKAKKKRGFVRYENAGSDASSTARPSAPPKEAARAPEAETSPIVESSASEDAAEASASPGAEGVGQSRQMDRQIESKMDRKERRKARRSQRRDTAADASAPADDQGAWQSREEPMQIETLEPQWPPTEEGWGEPTYLSNDDTMSMSSPQRVRFAIDNDLPLPLEHIRKHELLNAASFELAPVEQGHDFSVNAQLAASNREDGLYTLALAINGRPIGREGRRNAAITLVVDRSGSMKSQGRMEFVKRGLLRMVRELKTGDIVNLVTFDHRVCTRLQNFVVGRDSAAVLSKAITGIKPAGSTNLHAGLTQGYRLADAAYQPKYTNRVVIITDALANRGVTDPKTLSMVSDFYDARRIRLSGVGVGKTFGDGLLDALTEKGRGAYVFLGSQEQVEHVFGAGFTSLVETTATDVHYRLHLPITMRMQQFYGEESSVSKSEVQAVHFFADTSQVLLSDIEAWQGQLRPQDGLMLEVEYQHPESGETLTEAYAFSVAAMTERSNNVRKAEVLMHFAENLEDMVRNFGAQTLAPTFQGQASQGLGPTRTCQDAAAKLDELAQGVGDAEVAEVQRLWSKFCARYGAAPTGRPARKR